MRLRLSCASRRVAHHPGGDRVFVGRAQALAVELGQRLQRRVGAHQEVGLVLLEALGHRDQAVAVILDGHDREVCRMDQRDVVGLVLQALAQRRVVAHRFDRHRLVQQLGEVHGDGGIARANLVVRNPVGHALVDGEHQGLCPGARQRQRGKHGQAGTSRSEHRATHWLGGAQGAFLRTALAAAVGLTALGSNSKFTLPSFLSYAR